MLLAQLNYVLAARSSWDRVLRWLLISYALQTDHSPRKSAPLSSTLCLVLYCITPIILCKCEFILCFVDRGTALNMIFQSVVVTHIEIYHIALLYLTPWRIDGRISFRVCCSLIFSKLGLAVLTLLRHSYPRVLPLCCVTSHLMTSARPSMTTSSLPRLGMRY